MAVEPVVLDNDILAFNEASLAEAPTKFRTDASARVSASAIDERDHWLSWLLCSHSKRPCYRTSNNFDEISPFHGRPSPREVYRNASTWLLEGVKKNG